MGLFGIASPQKNVAAPQAPDSTIFDIVSMEDFETRVLKVSMEKPVLVDFWAPWCGPCKQLMPVLEAEVKEANGEVVLAKVNIDDHQQLAQALQIQSVPTVMAFFQGQPVTGFAGARPASEIKNLIAQLVKLSRTAKPDALDIPAALAQATQLMTTGEEQAAQQIYFQILEADPHHVEAYNGLVRLLIQIGALDQAQNFVQSAPEAIAKHPNFSQAKTALELALKAEGLKGALAPLAKKVEADPADYQARFELAQAQFGAGQKEAAIDNLLDIIAKDRSWGEDAARLELLKYFEALGFADPLAATGRKKLSRLLFS